MVHFYVFKYIILLASTFKSLYCFLIEEAHVLFTKKMDVVMAEEFGEATLETEVNVESGEVQWIRQAVVIQPSPRHTFSQNGCKRYLRITNLSLSDRGTYRCESLHDRTQIKLNVERKYLNHNTKSYFSYQVLWLH